MSKVAVLKTKADRVIEDYHRIMDLAEYTNYISSEVMTIIKLNLSWTLYYPACSTAPWQLDGLVTKLKKDKYRDILAVENQTVVTHPWKGAYYNKWLPILNENDIQFRPLTNEKWISFKPKATMLAMYEIFEKKDEKILVPEMFMGSNIIHLPTVKTHGHTTTTGAMKDAFGGLIPKYRHHAHKRIHEILVDLLSIQKEIHKGMFALMDGCVCGDGAGPRVMDHYMGDIILASEDQVAIDAVSARIMGFEPLQIDYIRMAHDMGLGNGDIDQIEILGLDRREFEKLNFGFTVKKSPIIRWDQILRNKTSNIKWLHNLLFHSPIFKSFIFASEFYHDRFWYPFIGKKKIKQFRNTQWGKLFDGYEQGTMPDYEHVKDWDPY